MNISILLALILLFIVGSYCLYRLRTKRHSNHDPSPEELARVPQWAQEAVWYQIFVERFRNGDPTNDPTPADMVGAYPDEQPPNWKITPWTRQWYRRDDWFDEVALPSLKDYFQLRRYGGDLQGVLDKLDYIAELGVNALFFNPLNDAPSLHKYDARHWRHIDRNFGPDPGGDARIIAGENPIDPKTWQWTSADRLFLTIIRECHLRGIRVIMDFSWNHTGRKFWALEDIRKNGADSPYVDWYEIEHFNNQDDPSDELRYKSWLDIKYLAELRRDRQDDGQTLPHEGNFHSETARRHIFNVVARWLAPNGRPNEGIDGFRLDVAAEVPLGFWRDFRREVRRIKSDAFLVGEVWWKEWPDHLMEPQPFLRGDIFDGVMNYRWYRTARHFFAAAPDPLSPSAFVRKLERLCEGIRPECRRAMMNLTASHDSPRTSTSLYNRGKYKYHVKPYEDPDYKVDRPDAETWAMLRMLLIHQYTYVGSPHIWFGDEVGMWAADDPDCRKPMVWDDLTYEDETLHPIEGKERRHDPVRPDLELRAFYRRLIALRRANPALVYGSLDFILADDERNLLAYRRADTEREWLVLFNRSSQEHAVDLPVERAHRFRTAIGRKSKYAVENGYVKITIEPMTGMILHGQVLPVEG